MGPFQRTNAKMDQLGFVRGPARLIAAPLTQTPPTKIADVIKLDTAGAASEVQTITITGTPAGGTFTLSFKGVSTTALAYNSTSAQVVAALEALSVIGSGGVTGSGGPFPGTAVVITFAGGLANSNQPMIVATSALTGGTTPAIAVAETTPGIGQYDLVAGTSWFELGGTKNGVVPSYNNTEEEFTIDQQLTAVGAQQNSHEWSFQTSLVEVTPENLAIVWDMGSVTTNLVPTIPEKKVGMGSPIGYTLRRVGILHRRPNGLLRLHFFRIMRRSPVETPLTYASTGEQQSVPFRMSALADENVATDTENVGYILDQTG